ncbi:type I restriction-modification system%2C S subunit [Streptococcus pneumoniae]|nr:type I restriction-modification system%2C S subunit [Streptococcus pneumoniae]
MVEIVRGGSPRPIKDYLTSEVDGINWIKIGDTEKGEKYINNVKEKIKKSGEIISQFIYILNKFAKKKEWDEATTSHSFLNLFFWAVWTVEGTNRRR